MLEINFGDFYKEFDKFLDNLSNNRISFYKEHIMKWGWQDDLTITYMLNWYRNIDPLANHKSMRVLYIIIKLFNKHNTLGVSINDKGYVTGNDESLRKFKIKYSLVD